MADLNIADYINRIKEELSSEIKNVSQSTESFRQQSSINDDKVQNIIKDLYKAISSQRKNIDNIYKQSYESSQSSSDFKGKLDYTNSLIQRNIVLQNQILDSISDISSSINQLWNSLNNSGLMNRGSGGLTNNFTNLSNLINKSIVINRKMTNDTIKKVLYNREEILGKARYLGLTPRRGLGLGTIGALGYGATALGATAMNMFKGEKGDADQSGPGPAPGVTPAPPGAATQTPSIGPELSEKGDKESKGSWFSQHTGKYKWVDREDKPNSNASGLPDSTPGIALRDRKTLGHYFYVQAPNGKTLLLRQVDIGPSKWTGRDIDINAAAAEAFGYSPSNFPTDKGTFKYRYIGKDAPTEDSKKIKPDGSTSSGDTSKAAAKPTPGGGASIAGSMATPSPSSSGTPASPGATDASPTTPGSSAGGSSAGGTGDASKMGPHKGAMERGVNEGIASKLQQIESAFGKKLTISSGFRDPAHNARVGGARNSAHTRGNAIDVKFEGGIPETLKFIELASKAGVGGIGVYRPGSIHIDSEARRAWGPSYGRDSVPPWAENAIKAHETGKWGEYDPSARGDKSESSAGGETGRTGASSSVRGLTGGYGSPGGMMGGGLGGLGGLLGMIPGVGRFMPFINMISGLAGMGGGIGNMLGNILGKPSPTLRTSSTSVPSETEGARKPSPEPTTAAPDKPAPAPATLIRASTQSIPSPSSDNLHNPKEDFDGLKSFITKTIEENNQKTRGMIASMDNGNSKLTGFEEALIPGWTYAVNDLDGPNNQLRRRDRQWRSESRFDGIV